MSSRRKRRHSASLSDCGQASQRNPKVKNDLIARDDTWVDLIDDNLHGQPMLASALSWLAPDEKSHTNRDVHPQTLHRSQSSHVDTRSQKSDVSQIKKEDTQKHQNNLQSDRNKSHPRKRFNFEKQNQRSFHSNNQHNNKKNERFRYGNYNRYYGYRNGADGTDNLKPDSRLEMIPKELIQDKTVLDIGCNTGQVTVSIAKDFAPKTILGIDIDAELIKMANKNLTSYCHDYMMQHNHFPKSMPILFGKILSIPYSQQIAHQFPNNLSFEHGNFVVDREEDLRAESPIYDCILCLSITKWIHLNWGDAGLKLFFRRAFLNLRPGGCFIMEPQAFSSYYKKAKQIPDLLRTYHKIEFKPEHFKRYLLEEVGFHSCDLLGTPSHQSKGFQRPLYAYTKE